MRGKKFEMVLEMQADSPDRTGVVDLGGGHMAMFTPPIGEDYWLFRVKVSKDQAVVGFHKFGTIGIGFAKEDYDWNTNLPYTSDTEKIYNHIKWNKGDTRIRKPLVMKAIGMIQEAARRVMEQAATQ